ncbi:type II toxin-antitoxin system HipA family toxin [Denitromonas sp.]|uniref:type II toxin-antitoxin system HipA family toxin n=1 Tax=Denitromonas sp. TaxID=2734609 RepID=UPI003A88F8E7
MGRPRASTALGLWMNGQHVGRWEVSARGEHRLSYAPAWIDAPLGRPVSLSMPLRPADAPYTGEVVRNFFENLLPDNTVIRQRIARQFGTTTEAFGLLAEIGRDCVGALQLLPEGQTPDETAAVRAEPLSDAQVEAHLARQRSAPTFGADEENTFRISLAGAQEKSAFLWHDGAWCRPLGSTPTTHIFKLPLGQVPGGIDLSTSVENEWLCLRLLAAFGVPVAESQLLRFGQQRVLSVTRFDRRRSAQGRWLRLPQEDFAQVFGIDPNLKYESHGGPGVRDILDRLLGATEPAADRADFFRSQVLFWMLAAIDGHAKNFSVFIEPRGRYRLTPRYDVLSAYPVMGYGAARLSPHKIKMAMAVWGRNRHYRWSEVRRAHVEQTAADCRVPDAAAIIDTLVARTPQAIADVAAALPEGFPPALAEAVFDGLARAAQTLAAG